MDWAAIGNAPMPQLVVDGSAPPPLVTVNNNVAYSFAPAVEAAAEEDKFDTPKCRRKGCKVNAEAFNCSAKGCCDAWIHLTCYHGMCKKNNVDVLEGVHCCAKNCYNKAKKTHSVDGRHTWNNDGKKGPDDPNTSMKILLEWFLTEGNYNKHRGKKNNGKKKKEFQEKLAEKMTAETRSKRDWKQVERKISSIEEAWHTAHDWATNTGVGVKEEEGQQKFEDCVRSRCYWCFDLEDAFLSRSSSRPKMTTDELLADEDEEEEEDKSGDENGDDASSSSSSSSESDTLSGSPKEVPKEVKTKKTPKRTPSNTGRNGGSSRNKRGGSSISLMDEESLSLLMGSRQSREKHVQKKLKLEQSKVDLERQRLQQDSKFDTKQKSVAHVLSMIKVYNELKNDPFNYDDTRILEMCPEMETLRIIKPSTTEENSG